MGEGLADGFREGRATGRACRLAEVILWHGGEAEAPREAFRALSPDDRAALLASL